MAQPQLIQISLDSGGEKRAFDSAGFFDLLGQVMTRHNTGVVSLRIHIRDGLPWAVSVDFDGTKEKAA
jgi:hypothetical protein